MESPRELPLDAWAVLALLREQETHGWTLARALAPNGEIGRVWSIKRAVVYRNVQTLIDAGLIERAGIEPGARGSPRTLLRLTPAGRGAVELWLGQPVEHVRDLRSDLLLKLVFAQRSGLDRAPLLQAQRAILVGAVDALDGEADAAEEPGAATVRHFRLETARAGLRFVEGELARLPGGLRDCPLQQLPR
jgi:DNA-binding PadR family transcriptional regulator